MPLFKDLSDEEIINLLEAMQPEITMRKTGELMTPENSMDIPNDIFCFVVRGKPLDQCREILNVYTNNPPGEPGMMMGEIPVLSQMLKNFLGLLAQKVTDERKEKCVVEEKLEALENPHTSPMKA